MKVAGVVVARPPDKFPTRSWWEGRDRVAVSFFVSVLALEVVVIILVAILFSWAMKVANPTAIVGVIFLVLLSNITALAFGSEQYCEDAFEQAEWNRVFGQ